MRLIDADLLLKSIEVTSQFDCVGELLKMYIENFPTAYDVDKVVEQLEEYVKYAEQKAAEYDEAGDIIAMDELDIEAKVYQNAIEIVKSSGVVGG